MVNESHPPTAEARAHRRSSLSRHGTHMRSARPRGVPARQDEIHDIRRRWHVLDERSPSRRKRGQVRDWPQRALAILVVPRTHTEEIQR